MSSMSVDVEMLPEAPQADVDLDARTLVATLAVDYDGDPVLVLADMDTTVIVEFGIGGAWASATQAAERLGNEAMRFAQALRDVRARRQTSSVKEVRSEPPGRGSR